MKKQTYSKNELAAIDRLHADQRKKGLVCLKSDAEIDALLAKKRDKKSKRSDYIDIEKW